MPEKPAYTPEEFAEKMRELHVFDIEGRHKEADQIMCELLEYFGYQEGVEIFRKMDKWYA